MEVLKYNLTNKTYNLALLSIVLVLTIACDSKSKTTYAQDYPITYYFYLVNFPLLPFIANFYVFKKLSKQKIKLAPSVLSWFLMIHIFVGVLLNILGTCLIYDLMNSYTISSKNGVREGVVVYTIGLGLQFLVLYGYYHHVRNRHEQKRLKGLLD